MADEKTPVRLTGKEFKLEKDQLVINRADLEKAISSAGAKPGAGLRGAEIEVTVKIKF